MKIQNEIAAEYLEYGDTDTAIWALQNEIDEIHDDHLRDPYPPTHDLLQILSEDDDYFDDAVEVVEGALNTYLNELGTICMGIQKLLHYYYQYSGYPYKVSYLDTSCGIPELTAVVSVLTDCLDRKVQLKEMCIQHEDSRMKVNSADPFDRTLSFPAEILSAILCHLGTQDLRNASQVSRRWHDSVMAHSNILRAPEFPEELEFSQLACYLRTCQKYGITYIPSMRFCGNNYVETGLFPKYLLQYGVQVGSLELWGGGMDFSRLHNYSLTSGRTFDRLHTFYLTYRGSRETNINDILACLPSLKNLYVFLEAYIDSSEYEEMHPVSIPALDLFNLSVSFDESESRNLCDVFLRKCDFNYIETLELALDHISRETMTNLFLHARPQTVSITTTDISAAQVLDALSAGNVRPATIRLDASWTGDMSPHSTKCLSGLHQLELGTLYNITSKELEHMFNRAGKTLKVLRLSSPEWSLFRAGCTMNEILEKCPCLEKLVIDGDEKVIPARADGGWNH